jgi:hypothetical protein
MFQLCNNDCVVRCRNTMFNLARNRGSIFLSMYQIEEEIKLLRIGTIVSGCKPLWP